MKIDKISSNRVKFTFDVTVADFDHALEHAFDHVKQDVEVKGFRKGHVTRAVYESKFGVESLFEDALNHVLHHKLHEAVANEEYQLVGDPVPGVDFATVQVGQPFEVTLEFAIKPDIELGNYKNLVVDKIDNTVTNEEVAQRVNELLSTAGSLEPKTGGTLENGDTAIFDFEGFNEGVPFEGGKSDNHEMVIGSGQFIPGFEEQMVGMSLGEEKDLNVTFPEEYHAPDLAGKPVVFKVKLNEMKKEVTPELNDEWVATLGKEAKTVKELEESILKELTDAKVNENKNKSIEAALKQIAETSKVDIPVEMIDYEVNQALKNIEAQAKQYGLDLQTYISITGSTEEALKEQLKVESEARILNSLIIEAIAKEVKFEVTAEEIASKYDELAAMYQMPIEEVKKHITDNLVVIDLEFAKAVDYIFDNLNFK